MEVNERANPHLQRAREVSRKFVRVHTQLAKVIDLFERGGLTMKQKEVLVEESRQVLRETA